MRAVIFIVIAAILGSSLVGVGHLSGNPGDNYIDWYKKFWDYFDFKKYTGFMNTGGSNNNNMCHCEEHKQEHKEYYDKYKKYYDDNKNHFSKDDYKKYLDDYKKYFDYNRQGFDRSDFKQYMDYYKKYLDDNKKYFSDDDYKKYSDEHKKYSNEYPSHGDHCKCMDDNNDHTIIDKATVDFNINQREIKDKDQTYFQNIVDQCIFSSPQSFQPLCIKCKFLTMDGTTVLAKGEVIKLDKSYKANQEVVIPMSSVPWAAPYTPVANDVQYVDKVEITICGEKEQCPDVHKDKCKCDERKKDHKKHYDDFDKYYKDNKNKFGKDGHSKYMDDYEKYMNEEGKYMDKSECKMFDDYHGQFLKNNKNSFSDSDYKRHSEEHEKHSKDCQNHDDDDDNNSKECKEKSGFFVGGGKVYVPKSGNMPSFTLTHGFELHCDATLGPNNLEINWLQNKFHLEELEAAKCIDDGTPNEPPPSPHPGSTLDVYTGEGFGRYNGVCGAYATWSMDDNGEPGKGDQILSLKIRDSNGNEVLNINDPLKLQSGNHQFVPHPSSHPNPPNTAPCPQMTP